MFRKRTKRHAACSGCNPWKVYFAVFLVFVALGAKSATTKHVLLLHGFGRNFSPFDEFSQIFRSELAEQMGRPINFYDIDLESPGSDAPGPEGTSTSYLGALYSGRHPDLVVTIGGPAARYAQKYRDRLFPTTPTIYAAVATRLVQNNVLTTNDTVVPVSPDPAHVVGTILHLLPTTTNIVVVIGKSPLEEFWLNQIRQDFRRFSKRTGFMWWNELPFHEIQRRASTLPPCSAIYFFGLAVDAEGVPYPGQQSLIDLHAVANAPIFGLVDIQVGNGVVGGSLTPIEEMARTTARVGARILRGEPAGNIKTPTYGLGTPIFDWRELQRWGISEQSLPPGSVIRFRQFTLWQLYKWRVLLALAAVSAVVGAVFYRHSVRIRAAQQTHDAFTRELILSQETERKRIASDLHDGLGQVLLILKNRLGLLASSSRHLPEVATELDKLTKTAAQAIGDVRSVCQALRPVALEQIGLTKAIEWMIEQLSQASPTKFSTEIESIDGLLAPDLEMNLYRIVQEAFNNVTKHAHATQVIARIKREPWGISLSIFDDGRGFVPPSPRADRTHGRKLSQGLANIAERAKLLNGRLEIQSGQGTGTRLTLTIPLPEQVQNKSPTTASPEPVSNPQETARTF